MLEFVSTRSRTAPTRHSTVVDMPPEPSTPRSETRVAALDVNGGFGWNVAADCRGRSTQVAGVLLRPTSLWPGRWFPRGWTAMCRSGRTRHRTVRQRRSAPAWGRYRELSASGGRLRRLPAHPPLSKRPRQTSPPRPPVICDQRVVPARLLEDWVGCPGESLPGTGRRVVDEGGRLRARPFSLVLEAPAGKWNDPAARGGPGQQQIVGRLRHDVHAVWGKEMKSRRCAGSKAAIPAVHNSPA